MSLTLSTNEIVKVNSGRIVPLTVLVNTNNNIFSNITSQQFSISTPGKYEFSFNYTVILNTAEETSIKTYLLEKTILASRTTLIPSNGIKPIVLKYSLFHKRQNTLASMSILYF